jgi:tRNA pseudouridine38-40 synthase
MPRYKLIIEYEGTRYSGWQKQPNARTVQGVLLETAKKIFKEEQFDIQGSGRTDAGVHALMQAAHLDVKTMLAPEIIRMKFNDLLPSDITLIEVVKKDKTFHARHSAVKRSYLYQISTRRTAFGKKFVWWIKDKLDVEAMNDASKLFIGMNDYSSFADDDKEEKSTKVFIEEIKIETSGDLILIRITGSHFLWKMVRRMIGVLTEIGRGKMKRNDLQFFLKNKSNTPAKYTAPPSGLFLEQVIYEGEKSINEIIPLINLPGRKFK